MTIGMTTSNKSEKAGMPNTETPRLIIYSSDRYAPLDLGGVVGWLLSATRPGFIPSIARVASTIATTSGFLYSMRITSFRVGVDSVEQFDCGIGYENV